MSKRSKKNARLFLAQLSVLIYDNMSDENFGIMEVCYEMDISRAQLHRRLKALTGRSTSHVIRAIRLEKAKDLVKSTNLSISEIASQTGFKNHSYFTASFVGEFGKTPSEMRGNT